jgi:hypothetical protein
MLRFGRNLVLLCIVHVAAALGSVSVAKRAMLHSGTETERPATPRETEATCNVHSGKRLGHQIRLRMTFGCVILSENHLGQNLVGHAC